MKPFPGIDFKKGDRGPGKEEHIREIQKALGLGPGGQTGVFGPTTEQLVVNFQKARDLDVDGVVGRNTWKALFQPAPAPCADLGEKALTRGFTFLSVREDPIGSNRGAEIDAWNARAGCPEGSFWCLAFVHAMVTDACAELDVAPDTVFTRTGSCSALYRWAKKNGRLTTRPRKGDVFLCIGGDTGHYHTGFVAADPTADDRFETLEGNSNAGGSANGIGVFHRKRGRKLCDCHFVAL